MQHCSTGSLKNAMTKLHSQHQHKQELLFSALIAAGPPMVSSAHPNKEWDAVLDKYRKMPVKMLFH